MSLTGSLFVGGVTALAVLAFVGLVAMWPRLAGRRPGGILARATLLLTVNVLVLLAAALQMNAKYLFFADWTDLTGALGGKVTATALSRGGSGAKAVDANVAGTAAAAAATLPPLPRAADRPAGVITATVQGSLSGLTGTVVVRIPPQYTAPSRARTRYPVLETFSGYPGTPMQWLDTMKLASAVDIAAAQKRMRPVLIVSPQLEFPVGVDTECVDGAPGPAAETWVTRDVPNYIAHTYRVSTSRSSWATIGLSAGGWCAAMATMLHPAQYSAAIAVGGYFEPWFGPQYEGFPPGTAQAKRYDLVALAHTPPPVAIWMETSHSDPTSYASSARFLKVVKPPLSITAVVLRNAGHRTSVWEELLPRALNWLGSTVPGFRPVR